MKGSMRKGQRPGTWEFRVSLGRDPLTGKYGFGDPPADHSFVAYRDLNGNGHWNIDKDDTVYRGNATITSCPQDVVLSPK